MRAELHSLNHIQVALVTHCRCFRVRNLLQTVRVQFCMHAISTVSAIVVIRPTCCDQVGYIDASVEAVIDSRLRYLAETSEIMARIPKSEFSDADEFCVGMFRRI